jgi:O-antigen/teichoic acid export membrane protein
MANKSIKKNFIYNLLNQVVQALVPVVITPYVSRVLGAEGIGLYSYAESIVSYFVLFAVLGTATFGQRTISYVQDDVEEKSRAFWEIYIFRLCTTLVTFAVYSCYIFLFLNQSQFIIFLILSLNLFNVIMDISWFFQGLEEFGKISIRAIIFRLISLALIFIFVKDESDIYIYVLIMVLYTVLGNMSLWIYLPKMLCRVKNIRPFKNIKTIFQFFLPTIAVQIYTVLDKSMIGWIVDGYAENGYYEQAEKIVRTALVAVTALGTVTIPRIAKKYKEGDFENLKYYIYRSYRYVWLMALPLMFGFIAVSSIFVPVYYGEGFEKCEILIPIFSLLLVIIGLSNVTGIQYFIPTGKQNVLTVTVVIGSIINFVLNLIFIPKLYSLGATIASVIAELSITIAGFIYIYKTKQFEIKPVFSCSWKYFVSALTMFAGLMVIKHFMPITILGLILIVLCGVLIYFVMLLILRDSFLLEILNNVTSSLKNLFKKNNNK